MDFNGGFLYNRMPKVANTTLMFTLHAHRAPDRSRLEVAREHKKNHREPSSLTARDVNRLNQLFKFCFVRNPYSRTLSAYLNHVRNGSYPKFRDRDLFEQYGKDPSFRDFCHYLTEGGLYANHHWAPQVSLLVLPPDQFDFIGKLENFDRDLQHVLDRISVPASNQEHVEVGGHSTGASEKLQDYYTEELRNRVYRGLKEDFEVFSYSKSLD